MTDLERFSPELTGNIAYEHLHRYALCSDLVAGKRVLDVACGEGYGTSILARSAAAVTGVDIDASVVAAANTAYGESEKVRFQVGDCRRLPFGDGQFDVVVSFETLEHIAEPERLVAEARRMLAPGGLFIVSTPNREIYNRHKAPNPFHVRELDIGEFREILGESFPCVEILGQRMAIVSVASPLNGLAASSQPTYRGFSALHSQTSRKVQIAESVARLDEPEYLIAICAAQPLALATCVDSIFVAAEDDLWKRHSEIFAWASGLHEEDEALRRRLAEAEEALAAEPGQSATLTSALATIEQLVSANASLLATCDRLEALNHASQRAAAAAHAAEVNALKEAIEQSSGALARAEAAAASRAAELEEVRRQAAASATDAAERTAKLEMELTRSSEAGERLRADIADLSRHLADRFGEPAADAAASGTAADEPAELVEAFETLALQAQELSQRERVQSALRDAEHRVRLALPSAPALRRGDYRGKVRAAEWRQLIALGLFDAAWCASHDPEPRRGDALERFKSHGVWLGRSPHPLFDSHWYALNHMQPDDPTPPIIAYLRNPDRRFARAHPLFDPVFYLRQNPDVARDGADPLAHFVRCGDQEGRQGHPLVSPAYLAETAGPRHGAITTRRLATDPDLRMVSPHPLFDAPRYLADNPDVAAGGAHPLQHYLVEGWRQGRSPHSYFEGDWYLCENAGLLAAQVNPLVDYVEYGAGEYRRPNPVFDPQYYIETDTAALDSALDPLTHFIQYGRAGGRAPSRQLSARGGLHPADADPMRRLLHRRADPPEASPVDARSDGVRAVADAAHLVQSWPPADLGGYWLPQPLREYIRHQFDESLLGAHSYLFSVIDAYAGDPSAFDGSNAQILLMERAKYLTDRRQTDDPEITIVIPAHNNLVYTLTAIVSILELPDSERYEILVGDDGSSDATETVIGSIGAPVHLVRHAENQGFLGNCNVTAQHARGDYIVFLNNDVIVFPGWLHHLRETFRADPGVGLAGSKLINGDGTLQEAGGILWRDGSGWNFGLGQDPLRPEFSYVKEVDYCSGASIALPTSLWRELGGFDPVFAPAYCEDSDLCMRVRAAGRKVVFQPFSQLVHHEGRSHGRDLNSGVKAYQTINQLKLIDRWSKVWSEENFDNGQSAFLARDRSRGRPHIVIVDHYVPQWDQDAGSRTIFHYIRMFVERGFHVTFWPDNLYRDPIYTPILQKMGVEVIYGIEYLGEFSSWIESNGANIDYFLLSRPHISEHYIGYARKHSKASILYYGHDLHYKRLENQYVVLGDDRLVDEAKMMKKLELNLCKRVDLFMYPSLEEITTIKSEIGSKGNGQNIPMNLFDDSEIAAPEEDCLFGRDAFSLLFVGGFGHSPNPDAVIWFVKEVMPHLIAETAQYRLTIVGSSPTPEIEALAGANVTVLGRVTDAVLGELYAHAGAAVAPLRFGGGVKGKVIEALARGAPVVTTPTGAQGIPDADQFMKIASEPSTFAAAVIDLSVDPAAAADRVRRGVAFIRREYTLAGVRRKLASTIPELGES